MVSEELNVIPGSNLTLEVKVGKVCLISQKLDKFPMFLHKRLMGTDWTRAWLESSCGWKLFVHL